MTKETAIEIILKRYRVRQRNSVSKQFNYMNYKVISEHDEIFVKIAGIAFVLASNFFLKITKDMRILEFQFIPCLQTKLILNHWKSAEDDLCDLSDTHKSGILCDIVTMIMNYTGNVIVKETGFHAIINPFTETSNFIGDEVNNILMEYDLTNGNIKHVLKLKKDNNRYKIHSFVNVDKNSNFHYIDKTEYIKYLKNPTYEPRSNKEIESYIILDIVRDYFDGSIDSMIENVRKYENKYKHR